MRTAQSCRNGIWALALGGAIAIVPVGLNSAFAGSADGRVETIVVTGSRIAGNFLSPTPVTSLGAQRLTDRAASNIGDIINELPSFRATQTPATTGLRPQAGYVGGRILDLRGLGSVRTLVLVNSKRFVPSTTEGTFDTNMIPSILLKRVDVVTGGASAQYGSDAVAGVVNLILDKRMNGLKGNVHYGISKRGDNSDFFASLAGGTDLTPHIHFLAGGDFERNLGVGDCQTRAFCRTETLNFGRIPGETDIPANNILPHIRPSSTAYNGVTLPIGYTKTAQPILGLLGGITFNNDGTPRHFIYGSRVNPFFQIGGEGKGQDTFFAHLNFVAPTKRYNAMGRLDWQITPDITAALTVNYGHLRANYSAIEYRSFTGIPIYRDNPFIPSSSDPTLDIRGILNANPGIKSFRLGRGFDSIGPGHITTRDNVFRTVLSFNGALSDTWSWDAYYEYGENSFRSTTTNAVITSRITDALDAVAGPNGPECRINADANPANNDPNCVAMNPFGQQISAAAHAYVVGTAFQTNDTTEHVVAANLHGDLFSVSDQAKRLFGINLPETKRVGIAIGGEFHSDKVSGNVDPLSAQGAFFTASGSKIAGQVQVLEGYIETEVPLLADLPLIHEFSLNAALRSAHYDRSNSSTDSTTNAMTWKFGAVWEPISAIRFRAARSRDVRAPNVSELFGPTTHTQGILTDPALGGRQTVVDVVSGSNALLRPEVGDTTTIGVVFKPDSGLFRHVTASIDYYDIKLKDEIATIGRQNIVDRCFQGDTQSCSLITRDSSGVATQVVDTLQNINRLINRGVDFEVDYAQPLGTFEPLSALGDLGDLNVRINATWVRDLEIFDSGGATQRAGQTGLRAGTPPGMPNLTLDGMVTWNYNALTLSAHIHYINAGFYYPTFVAPGDPGYSLANPKSSNTNSVPSRTYVDLLAQYHFSREDDRQYVAYFGIDNVFDTQPPLIPGAQGTGNNQLFSPVGMDFKVGLRFKL